MFVITGLGSYVNLGVIDAYATVKLRRRGAHRRGSPARSGPTACTSRSARTASRSSSRCSSSALVCDGDDHGVGFDLTWEGSFPAVEEEPHVISNGYSTILQSSRFAQMGSWTGEVRAGGETIAVDPATWLGSRDRSWGIRPVGDAEAPGRTADDAAAGAGGFWWLYVPLRFDDFQIIVIAQEKADGYRTLNDAKRVWADGRIEQLGWPEYDITYRSGTRHPEHATLHLTDMSREAGDARDRHPRVRALARWVRATATPTGPTASGRARTGPTRCVSTSPIPRSCRAFPSATSTTSATRSATGRRAGACSSTPASARTHPAGSPT